MTGDAGRRAIDDREAIFTPIRTANAFEQTVERIGRAIRMGLLRPGERLPSERELALQLALSRSTVREALRLLVEAGFLEARRGRGGGTFVAAVLPRPEPRDPQEALSELGDRLPDLLAYRLVLETGAAELAAERATAADCARLAALVAEAGAHHASDYPAYRAVDSRIHVAIAGIAGSAQLVEALTDMHARISEIMNGIPRSEETIVNSQDQHRRLLAAIEAGDRDAARVVMREHVGGIARLLSVLAPGR